MTDITFHLPIVPPAATSQSAGKRMVIVKGRPMFFKNRKQVDAEHDYMLLCAPHRPAEPLTGPVALDVHFVFPWRAGESKRNRAMGRTPKTTKPDGGNMLKALEDCLTKLGFWHDDAQVADERVTRSWGDDVGIYVRIQTMPKTLPLGSERMSEAQCSSPSAPGGDSESLPHVLFWLFELPTNSDAI